jgi:ubiquitin C-terminal hydrolase
MIVVLKRFIYDKDTELFKKLSHDVDIKQFVLNGVTFKIKGSALHGGAMKGGHYVFAEYDVTGNISRVFNDSSIETANDQGGRTPYILLYERQP